jgi:uncharacterized membrane protein YqiK
MEPSPLVLLAGFGSATLVLGLALLAWSRVRVGTDQAAILHRVGRPPEVVFSDAILVRLLGHAELVDLKAATIELAHSGGEGVHCRDAIKAALTVRFTLRVDRTADDVLKAATLVGADRVTDADTIHRLFAGKFAEAIASVVCEMEFQELLLERQRLTAKIAMETGTDLLGFTLEQVAVSRIDQVPIERLDANELLGARAILRITEETTRHRVEVARLEAEARLEEQRVAKYGSS